MNSKHLVKCELTLKFIQFSTVSDLFPLDDVQKMPMLSTLCSTGKLNCNCYFARKDPLLVKKFPSAFPSTASLQIKVRGKSDFASNMLLRPREINVANLNFIVC